MERLARAGMTFTHAFVASPTCAPSRAALLTGLMPARNGAEDNHALARAAVRKLPTYFEALGYEVVAFGKVAHYKHARDYGFQRAEFDTFMITGGSRRRRPSWRHGRTNGEAAAPVRRHAVAAPAVAGDGRRTRSRDGRHPAHARRHAGHASVPGPLLPRGDARPTTTWARSTTRRARTSASARSS